MAIGKICVYCEERSPELKSYLLNHLCIPLCPDCAALAPAATPASPGGPVTLPYRLSKVLHRCRALQQVGKDEEQASIWVPFMRQAQAEYATARCEHCGSTWRCR